MEIRKTSIEGLIEIFPRIFKDERGFFLETHSIKAFTEAGLNLNFVQDNQSFSKKGVVRGLHFQKSPFAQGKLVRVITGKALDIAVDIRPESPTFGKWESFLLDSANSNIVYVPEGFAHGFLTLSDTSEFLYKTTDFYHPQSERCILWNDATLNIHWPENLNIQLSPKDSSGQALNESELFL